jgi:hypothetical protein
VIVLPRCTQVCLTCIHSHYPGLDFSLKGYNRNDSQWTPCYSFSVSTVARVCRAKYCEDVRFIDHQSQRREGTRYDRLHELGALGERRGVFNSIQFNLGNVIRDSSIRIKLNLLTTRARYT